MVTIAVSQESFKTDRRFYDDRNYPRGMARSGDFSLKEAQIIEQYGVALAELSSGRRAPVTDDEQHFIDVCSGQSHPENAIEKAWLKYHNRILTPKQFHTLFGRTKVESEEYEPDVDDVELEEDV